MAQYLHSKQHYCAIEELLGLVRVSKFKVELSQVEVVLPMHRMEVDSPTKVVVVVYLNWLNVSTPSNTTAPWRSCLVWFESLSSR